MNTELDSPLCNYGGIIMAIVGVFGWSMIPLFFIGGINLFSDYIRGDGVLGLGAIIGAVFGGIGFAFVFKTRQYKIIKKEKLNSNCQSVRNKGYHEYIDLIEQIKRENHFLEIPKQCKVCGHKTIIEYTYFGEKNEN